jgi:hypothetical protein
MYNLLKAFYNTLQKEENMTTTKLLILAFAVSLNMVLAQKKAEKDPGFPPLEDRYLGQKLPGLTPELFAAGLVSTEEYVESLYAFTPDMKEFYFSRIGGAYKETTVLVMKYKNNRWSKPSVLSSDLDIYKERFTPGLSELKSIESFKDVPFTGFTASSNGAYYFYFLEGDGSGHMSYSRLINGKYEKLQKMNTGINSGKYIAHPFIAQDESYLMWDAEKEGASTPDIYISFRQPDGSWGAAINMGDKINTAAYEQRPRVTPDGKYLFFWRGDKKFREDGSTYWIGNPYWVDAQIIESLRPAYSAEEPEFPPLADRYFGEQPPGLTPKLFAPKIVSPDGLFEGGSYSPDMKEFYFSRKNGKYTERTFFVIKYENDEWGNEAETDIHYPKFSKDGNTIYRGNKYRDKTDNGWSELKSMGTPFADKHIMGISFSEKGTAFFDEFERPDTVGAISFSRLIDGKYEPRQKMDERINTGTWIAHPHVAPDESYLIWDVEREDGYGGSDIYISFRAKDGSWLPAMNMGDKINTELHESGAGVSVDGKYLFFSRGQWEVKEDGSENWVGRPYWVDAQVIENLRPSTASTQEDGFTFPPLEGPYMGQKPPGMTAEPFAPGIISKEGWELEGVFAPGMKEFYFTTSHKEPFKPTVIGFRQQNNVWKKYIEFRRSGETAFSPDGNRMHMAEGYKDRDGEGWSERKSLGPMFDREDWGVMRLTASSMGTYVFDDYKNGDVIRISRIKDGKRQEPVEMEPLVNSGEWTAHPFIAPDESYLIWDSEREGGFGDSDLYISFKQKDGSWGPAINMGEKVNSAYWDAYASVTPDGKYILFNRGMDEENDNVDIYWVDAKIIETLRPN